MNAPKNPAAAPSAPSAPATAPQAEQSDLVRVRATGKADHEWYNAGRLMQKGDVAQVDRESALRLDELGLAEVV